MKRLKELGTAQYIIMPATLPFASNMTELHNRVFNFWFQRWTEAFKVSGAPKAYWPDHYQRQTLVTALLTADEVLGCHLYTLYNLNSEATIESEYFHYLPEEARQKLKQLKLDHVMTMEYLCANPDWKKNSANTSISALLTTLGLMTAHSFKVEAALGMPIIGNSVDRSANLLGRKSIHAPIEKYGYQLDFSYIRTDSKITVLDRHLAETAKVFWQSKKTYLTLPRNEATIESPNKKIAV